MSKGNSKDFNDVVYSGVKQSEVDNHQTTSLDAVVRYYHANREYRHDYRDAIHQYFEACGCKIYSLDFLELSVSKPTKSVDPIDWYENTYSPRFYWSGERKFCLSLFLFGLFVLFCNIYGVK